MFHRDCLEPWLKNKARYKKMFLVLWQFKIIVSLLQSDPKSLPVYYTFLNKFCSCPVCRVDVNPYDWPGNERAERRADQSGRNAEQAGPPPEEQNHDDSGQSNQVIFVLTKNRILLFGIWKRRFYMNFSKFKFCCVFIEKKFIFEKFLKCFYGKVNISVPTFWHVDEHAGHGFGLKVGRADFEIWETKAFFFVFENVKNYHYSCYLSNIENNINLSYYIIFEMNVISFSGLERWCEATLLVCLRSRRALSFSYFSLVVRTSATALPARQRSSHR